MFGILGAVVLLIVYGSLYPWQFVARDLPANPLYILLHSWDANRVDRRFIADVAINLAIYIPLGMSAFLAMRRFGSRALELAGPVVLGTLLSASIEMIQLYTPHRICSAVDLLDNSIGSALGVAAGLVFVRIVDVPASLQGRFHARDRCAVALLFCWFAYLLFPVFPDLSLHVWKSKLLSAMHASLLSPVPIALRAAEWFAAGCLLAASGARSPAPRLGLALLLLPVQFTLMSHDPVSADFIGAALGVAAFSLVRSWSKLDLTGAAALALAIALRGIAPFHFAAEAQSFNWIPFVGLLNTEWQYAIQILLRKLFQYGAAIWLLHRAGVRLLYATGAMALLLAVIEAIQTRVPTHVAESTDPLLALMLGLIFMVFNRREPGEPVPVVLE